MSMRESALPWLSIFVLMSFPALVHPVSTESLLAGVVVPPGTRVLSVGNEVLQNGHVVSLATYHSDLPLEETVDYFRALWTVDQDNGFPGLVENRVSEWQIISHMQDGFNIVLQLYSEEPHRSSGYLSVMKTDAGRRNRMDSGVIDLSGFDVLSVTRSQDVMRTSVMSVLSSTDSTDSVARQLISYWLGRNWKLVSENEHEGSKVILLNHKSDQLELVINNGQASGSIVVMNLVGSNE